MREPQEMTKTSTGTPRSSETRTDEQRAARWARGFFLVGWFGDGGGLEWENEEETVLMWESPRKTTRTPRGHQ